MSVLSTVGSGLKDAGEFFLRGVKGVALGPDYEEKARAADLANQMAEVNVEAGKQKIAADAEYEPIRRADIQSRIEARAAAAKTQNDKLELTRQLGEAQIRLAREKLTDPQKAAQTEAEIAALNARARMLDAQGSLYTARAADPQAFAAGGNALVWAQGPQGVSLYPKGFIAAQPPGTYTPPMPAQMQQNVGMADALQSAIAEMKDLAARVTQGPVAGNLSQVKQKLYPSGDEAQFDFDTSQLVDLVYLKSGKQINANEMRLLKSLIPDRGRANLPLQVAMFEKYANKILEKYTGQGLSTAGGGVPTGAHTPGTPGATPGPASTPPGPGPTAGDNQEIIDIGSDEDYDALNPGQLFRGPDGQVRRKPL